MLIGLYSEVPRSGKSTVASYLVEQHGFSHLSLAQPIKSFLMGVLNKFGISSARAQEYIYGNSKHKLIPEIGTTGRDMMVSMGTSWGRKTIHPDIWLNYWESKYDPSLNMVVDDVRFLNEFNRIRELGGEMWKIAKEYSSPSKYNNPSEANLEYIDNEIWDEVIVNMFLGKDILYSSISEILNSKELYKLKQ